MAFELTKELTDEIKELIASQNEQQLTDLYEELHFADLAEILDGLNIEEATYLVKILDAEKTSDALMELEEDIREQKVKVEKKEIKQKDKNMRIFKRILKDKNTMNNVQHDYFIPGDNHPNELGHKIIADLIIERLQSL